MTLFILLIVGTVSSFAQKARVGEVRYSVLNPEQFIAIYGKTWVLLDGRNINGTDLWKVSKLVNIPDGRGVFVRGSNMKRDTQTGDPDGDRTVGSYQTDAFATHTHKYSDAHYAEVQCGNIGLFGNKGDSDNDNNRCTTDQVTEASGGSETRPRNIVLYTYVKVNKRKSAQGAVN